MPVPCFDQTGTGIFYPIPYLLKASVLFLFFLYLENRGQFSVCIIYNSKKLSYLFQQPLFSFFQPIFSWSGNLNGSKKRKGVPELPPAEPPGAGYAESAGPDLTDGN